jgi:peptide/nickel transport system substrate-binding protein
VPDLAVALPAPTDNGLTYTFHIRSGIRYSNGVLLRASDFVLGLQRAFKIGKGPLADLSLIAGAGRCQAHPANCDLSQGIVADDAAKTVTFHLTKPDPDLFAQLALPAAYPVPAGTPVQLRGRWVPGTGAYEISAYTPGPPVANNPRAHGLLVLTRNRYFHQWSAAAQPAGFPNRIIVRTNYSPAQQVAAVEQGRADLAWDPPPAAQLTALSQNSPSQLHTTPQAQTTYLWLNVRSTPFDNLLARRALNYAVDRGALSQIPIFGASAAAATCQLLPPDYPGHVPYCPYTIDPTSSGRWLAPDIAQAQALVRKSGTLGARVTLAVPPGGRGYAHALVASMRKIGYRARLVQLPPSAFAPSDPARFQAGLFGWYSDYVAPAQFFEPLLSCSAVASPTGVNIGGFCDHSLDASIDAALSNETLKPGVASQQWAAIDRMATDTGAVVPLSNQLESDFVASRVGNYHYNPQWGMLVDQLWVR